MSSRFGRGLSGRQFDITLFPPIQFRDIAGTAFRKPLLNSKRDEEVDVLVLLGNLEDRGVAHVIVVVVADHYSIDIRDFLHLARDICVSLGSHEAERTAPGREHRVEQDSEAARELDVVAGMAHPSRAQLLGLARRQEIRLVN